MRKLFYAAMFLFLSTFISHAQQPYLYTGIGPRLAMAVVDRFGLGLNAGVHVDVAFDLGVAGELHYYPLLDFQFTGDDNNGRRIRDEILFEMGFNFFDFRYYVPIPKTIPIRPYAGLAPMAALEVYTYDRLIDDPRGDFWDSETDADLDFGFNFYAGIDFLISRQFILFGEFRGKAGGYDAAKLTVGMTFPIHGAR